MRFACKIAGGSLPAATLGPKYKSYKKGELRGRNDNVRINFIPPPPLTGCVRSREEGRAPRVASPFLMLPRSPFHMQISGINARKKRRGEWRAGRRGGKPGACVYAGASLARFTRLCVFRTREVERACVRAPPPPPLRADAISITISADAVSRCLRRKK